jgi:hypothetical protein
VRNFYEILRTDIYPLRGISCTAIKSAAKRAREQSAQKVVSTGSRGRKRRVLGDMDPSVQRKAPKLASKEPEMGYGLATHERTDETKGG